MIPFRLFEKETFDVAMSDYRKSMMRKMITKIVSDKSGYVKSYNDNSVTFEVETDAIKKYLLNVLKQKGISTKA